MLIYNLTLTADVEETWNIADAVKKLQATPQKRNEWQVAFKEGVELEDKVVYDTFGEETKEDFIARYDFSFLTPRSQSMRCKVSKISNVLAFCIAYMTRGVNSTKVCFGKKTKFFREDFVGNRETFPGDMN